MASEPKGRQWSIPADAVNLVAGGVSGVTTKTCVAPLERLKILRQVQTMKTGAPKYSGSIIQSLRVVVREEGLRGLYKGNGTNVLRVVPVYALKFTMNDAFKNILRKDPDEELSPWQLLLAGSMAGLFQTTVTYPLDLVRARLSLSQAMRGGGTYNGILHCMRTIISTEGVRALYKGFGMTMISATPYVGLQMTLYDLFKRALPHHGDRAPAMYEKLVCGAMAGLTAQTITFPGDVVRRRMQLVGMDGAKKEYTSTMDCMRKLYRKEGWRAFYRGLGVNVVRCLPGAAIQFAVFDTVSGFLLKHTQPY